MLNHIIKFETISLLRSGWLWAIMILMVAFMSFAAFNGQSRVAERTNDIEGALADLDKSDATMLKNIDLLEKGEETGLSYWMLPTEPTVVGSRHPRIAAMTAQPLAMISTGQSDLYGHFVKTSSYGYNFALDNTEIANPVQQLFGTFDLTFVFVFIFPLLIIAFTFNLLSREKEQGTLRVIGAQPISITKWVLSKMLYRFVLFALLSVVFFLIIVGLFTPNGFSDPSAILLAILQIVGYELFWFVLCAIVNIKINNSSRNAMVLIGIWLLVVLIIPVTANQIGSSLYPSPSRLTMLNKIRQANKDIEKKQSEILNSFLRDHPELASADEKSNYSFWHRYYASQDILKEEIQPIIDQHEDALHKRQRIIQFFKYLSPAIIFQESFNHLAGTSSDDYDSFQSQVMNYTQKWRDHIIPLLFKGQKYSRAIYEQRPVFNYAASRDKSLLGTNILATFVLVLILGGLFLSRKTTIEF